MMKKLLLLLTVAIAMLALPLAAHADKTKWTNPNYDFNKLHRINLVSWEASSLELKDLIRCLYQKHNLF